MEDRPKRFITTDKKLIQLPVTALKIGMYLESLDRPWEETPFLFQGFVVQTEEELHTLRDMCEYVYIDPSRGIDLSSNPKNTAIMFQERKVIPSALPNDIQISTPASPPKQISKKIKPKRTPYPLPSTSAADEYPRALGYYKEGLAVAKDFMTRIAADKPIYIQPIKESVSDCIQSILRNPDAMLWLSKIRNEDQYTLEHCFNVCLLALIFGRHLGLQHDELFNLGICAMLLDVGKMSMPSDILNKPDNLNKIELQIMRTHPEHGRDTLIAQDDVPPDAIEVVYSHHETYDGKGYPLGISGEAIPEFSRIITICDVFDAITSDRVYKKAQTSLEAQRILYENRDSTFDPNLVIQFIECIGLYPPGSIVELSTGEVAIVLATNFKKRRFPKILIVLDKDKKPCPEQILDLSTVSKNDQKNTHLIKTTIANGSYGIRFEDYVKNGLKVG